MKRQRRRATPNPPVSPSVLDRSVVLHCATLIAKRAGIMRRRQRERSLFKALLPDADKMWPAWLKRIDTLVEDEVVIDPELP